MYEFTIQYEKQGMKCLPKPVMTVNIAVFGKFDPGYVCHGKYACINFLYLMQYEHCACATCSSSLCIHADTCKISNL